MKRGLVQALCATTVLLASLSMALAKGTFKGDVVAKWLDDNRRMQLTEPFGYIDEHGRHWDVPSGTIVDGASIPSFFWSIVGAPFTGPFRKASVIHDYYCDTMSRPWREVHMVFFEAQLAEGNNVGHAKLLYGAVYAWGPRWEIANGTPRRTRDVVEKPSTNDIGELQEWVNRTDPSLDEIVRYVQDRFPR